MSAEAAERNFCVLSKFNFNLETALKAQAKSPLGYGSKFRDPSLLEQIFGQHPNWKRLHKILTEGSNWPLEALSQEAKLQDLDKALKFGKHKGATEKPDLLKQLVKKTSPMATV